MAEDDDDDSFGEFTFASSHPTVNSASQIPVTTGDDEWGDFNFFQNNKTDHDLNKSPPPPRTQLDTQTQPKWEKIKGAMPLSLFGDDDEEDEKPVLPVAGDDVKQSTFSGNSGFVPNNNGDKRNAHLGINDLIANLYGQSQQQQSIKAAINGNELDFTAINSTVSKDPLSNSGSNSFLSLNTVAAAAGNHGSDDEGGWEFIDAFSDSKSAQNEKDNKERSEKNLSSLGLPDGARGPIDLLAAPNNGGFVESNVTDGVFNSKPITNFQNGYVVESKADSKGTTNESSLNQLSGSEDFDDAFGDFESAFMEQPSMRTVLPEESKDTLGSHDTSHGPVDLFAFSNGVPGGSHKENNAFDFSQSSMVQNGVSSDPFSQVEWMKTKDDSDSHSQPPGGGSEYGNVGKFEATFPEDGSKAEGSEASSKNYKEPVPLSIFGIEEDPQAESSVDLQYDLFNSSTRGKHARTQSSNLSINDILSDLYSQMEPVGSANHEPNPDSKLNLLPSTGEEYSSRAVVDDDFDDGSWEFKDASSQSRIENQNLSFMEKLHNCMNLFSSIKDELCVVARHHVHDLKKAQNSATLAGEEMKVAALNKKIQEALEELPQKDITTTENHLDNHSERVLSLNQYIETLHGPDFQVFESEYHLSRRLSLAESELRTAIDLINHITTVLKVLKLAPKDEPSNYVSQWVKVISVCSQELKHGTWILEQSLERNVHSELLSEQEGKQFIIALGEIYRAVVMLGATVKFYKPWILLSGVDLKGIHVLLEECDSLWSTSGLEEIIPVDYLLESIRRIRNLDELSIATGLLSQEDSQCRLSLLSSGVVPEMKMVIWNGDKYFVTLANLWANLISIDTPNLSTSVG